MLVQELIKELSLETFSEAGNQKDVSGGYTSDLLSDVMGNASEGQALISIQAHKNTVAVASLIGFPLIIICNARDIPEDMVKAAESEGISIARSDKNQFEISGTLYRLLGF